jgi:site-specific DNA recombinase
MTDEIIGSAAIVTRYSSDHQRDASLEDQERLCRALCLSKGWHVHDIYADRALSGSTDQRPGYQRMIADAQEGKFAVIVAESLDRLSRDQADIATLYKNMRFRDIALFTVSEGRISELHIGLKGTMNAMYIRDLADKTHRGLEGLVLNGLNPGGKAYGYRKARKVAVDGEEIRGHLEIVPEEAEIVIRIFREFAAGSSPIEIARGLNKDRVPGPRSGGWRDTTIRGHALRRTGIVRNALYSGRIVWDKQRYERDPATGNRVARLNKPGTEVIHSVPHLRIVEQSLWDRVQERLAATRSSGRSQAQQAGQFWKQRRPKHLFSNLIYCSCGSTMEARGKDYLGCRAAKSEMGCNARKSISRGRVEDTVLDALRQRLMQPEAVEDFQRNLGNEVNKRRQELDRAKIVLEKELGQVSRKLKGLYDAIADGLRTPGLKEQLEELEALQLDLRAQIATAPPPQPRLHPKLADVYATMVRDLHVALSKPATRMEAAQVLRRLVNRITVRVTEHGHVIQLTGNILYLLTLPGGEVPNLYESSVKVVAGACSMRCSGCIPFEVSA